MFVLGAIVVGAGFAFAQYLPSWPAGSVICGGGPTVTISETGLPTAQAWSATIWNVAASTDTATGSASAPSSISLSLACTASSGVGWSASSSGYIGGSGSLGSSGGSASVAFTSSTASTTTVTTTTATLVSTGTYTLTVTSTSAGTVTTYTTVSTATATIAGYFTIDGVPFASAGKVLTSPTHSFTFVNTGTVAPTSATLSIAPSGGAATTLTLAAGTGGVYGPVSYTFATGSYTVSGSIQLPGGGSIAAFSTVVTAGSSLPVSTFPVPPLALVGIALASAGALLTVKEKEEE